jgi:taurine dioxygenase
MLKTVDPVMPTHPLPDGVSLFHYSPSIGTEVHGIDLRQPLDDDTFKFLSSLLLERKVIFFRNQDLTKEQHMDLGRRWGELEVLRFLDFDEEHPELLTIRKGTDEKGYENIWHSDVSWREEPSLGSILRARRVPAVGGDTLWCDMVAVYEALSPSMKEMIADLKAVYSVAAIARRAKSGTVEEILEQYPPPAHPVVRTHPETGRKLLYLSRGHLKKIKGLSPEESEMLVAQLTSYASIPEFQCRFRWENNSIAFWDNRSTQHYAISDYFPQERFMDRVTIKGDRPI